MADDIGELQERIRVRAYYLWAAEGYPSGREQDFWRRAEPVERSLSHPDVGDLRAKISEGAAYVHDCGPESQPFAIGAGLTSSRGVDEVSGLAYIRLANGSPGAASYGATGGYSLRVPDAVEAAASGQSVSVSVVARAANRDHAKFALAYSTNEVGNSGWRWLTAAAQWSICRMDYEVPVMKNGHGDFIGLLPDSEGKPGVEICGLAVHVH
jgi:hypothetical protein